jgi:glycosyltransferase involved in cell wall biosynthesis
MLSIVMPVYNGEKTVGRAIKSILNQSYNNFEFIIIDDCSQDQTLKILHDYQEKDQRIKILKNKTNLGIAASLNKGIIESKGEWIVRMDDDDISLPDRLKKQMDFLKNNPDVDIFGGKCIFQDINGNEIKSYSPNYPPVTTKEIEKLFYHTCPLMHNTIFMNKQKIIDIGLYNKDFSGAEDYELWVRGWKNGLSIKNMNEYLVRFTVNPGKRSLKRLWTTYYVRNYIIKQYNFPTKYYLHNFALLVKDILIKVNLFNPKWSVRDLIANIRNLVSIR